ncbi:MAG: response regulator [Anaerolineae bacterium]|nr:response regulator [Anaerolineae bacterium]
MEKIRVQIIDEHPAACRALAARLSTVASLEVVGAQSAFVDGLESMRAARPDVVLLELKWKTDDDAAPLAAIGRLLARSPAAVIVLTSFVDEAERSRMLQAGARRYLLKDIDTGRLIHEIEAVANEAAPRALC